MTPLDDWTFHHFGLALKSDRTARDFLGALGYHRGETVYDPLQNVRLALCEKAGEPSIELITPGEGEGPLSAILKRYDQLFYHSCYSVPDRRAALEKLEKAGLRVIENAPPTPAVLFGGRQVSFHTIVGYGLIELLDAD